MPTTQTVIGLTPGTTYKFKVKARNIIGQSEFSETTSILAAQIPDEPTDLVNVPQITLANQIGLQWIAPVFDGGSPVIDYRVWYDNASGGAFEVLTEGVVTNAYTATGLIQGATYRFKVQARNVYGYSFGTTNEVSILAAQIPDIPLAPVTSFIANTDTVRVTWVAPDNGGSPITSYTVYFADLGEANYIE